MISSLFFAEFLEKIRANEDYRDIRKSKETGKCFHGSLRKQGKFIPSLEVNTFPVFPQNAYPPRIFTVDFQKVNMLYFGHRIMSGWHSGRGV